MKKRRRAEVPNEQPYEEIQLKGYYRNYAFEPDEDDVDTFDRANRPLPSTAGAPIGSPANPSNSSNLANMSSRLTESVPRLNYSSTRNSPTDEAVINLKNVYFKYKQKQDWVLNGLQLTVPTGRIYSLLGAEDSGKTTIVKLVLGLLRPTSGSVRVFDHQTIGQMNCGRHEPDDDGLSMRRSIGYLPADDCLVLYEHFSIEELLTFYGRLYLMSRDEIELRIKQLACLLQIRCVHQTIGELSRAERRLISLAASIVHNPSLIVLDQPISGLCPEAARLVWELLSKQASSILIASAHFEEVRKFSDYVGFLRKGRLLAEKSTEAFLTGYRLDSLEQIYLKLCKLEKLKAKSTMDPVFLQIKQAVDKRIEDNFNSAGQSASDTASCIPGPSSRHAPDSPASFIPSTLSAPFIASNSAFGSSINQTNKQLDSLRPNRAWLLVFLALLHRHLKRSIRSPGHLLVQLLLPACQLILFYIAFGRNPHSIPIGIINDDRPTSTGQLSGNLNRLFLSNLDNYLIEPIDYANLDDAIRDVKRNRLAAIVHIGSQFSALFDDRLQLNDNLTRKEIERSTIFLHADLTNRFQADFVQRALAGSFRAFIGQLIDRTANQRLVHLNGTRKMAEDVYTYVYLNSSQDAYRLSSSLGRPEKFKNFAYLPFDFRAPIFGEPVNHPEHQLWRAFTVPRLLVNIVFIFSFGLNCIRFLRERKESNFERQYMANCSPIQLVLSYSLVQLSFSLLQIVLLLVLSVELFGQSVVGSLGPIVLLTALVSTSALSLGIYSSYHYRRPSAVILISGFAHFYLIIISGCLWPPDAYPKWTRYLGLLQPTNLPSQTLENLFFRGSSIGYSGFLISALYTLAFGYLSVRRFRHLSVH